MAARPIPPASGAAEYHPPAPAYYPAEHAGIPPRPVPDDHGDRDTRGLVPVWGPDDTGPVEEADTGHVTRPERLDLPPTTDHDQDMLGLAIPNDGSHVEIRQGARYSPEGAGSMIAPGPITRRPPAQVWTDDQPVQE